MFKLCLKDKKDLICYFDYVCLFRTETKEKSFEEDDEDDTPQRILDKTDI